jgi:hypothetical protein
MRPRAWAVVGIAAMGGLVTGSPVAVAMPSLDLQVAPRVKLGTPIFVRGVAGEAGRLVIVVRNTNGRVIGRTVKERVAAGAFGALVRLNDGARPGRATLSGVLSGAGTFEPVRDEVPVELVEIEPNFLTAFPATWPVGTPIPVKGRIAFRGRLVMVVRTPGGKPLGRAVVKTARPGPFSTRIRLGSGARPGRVVVTATLRSGNLIAQGTGSLVLQ